jgi:predicted phosphodiesterase
LVRIAFISDIHGNLVALEATLADIAKRGVDEIIFLGDLATLGPQPIEVIERVEGLACQMVMGNHDAFLIDQDDITLYTDDEAVIRMVAWCKEKMSSAELDYLRTFKPLLEMDFGDDVSMVCFHGSPRSNTEIILATTPDDELREALAGYRATIMMGGHTHIQMQRRFFDTLVVNAGSVGAPFWEMPPVGRLRIMPWAEYAIIEVEKGVIDVQLLRVPVDLDAVHAAILASDMDHPEQWLKFWE